METTDSSAMSFPCKLYNLLEDAEEKGYSHVVSWQSGGRSFRVYQPEYFANYVMQDYFAQTKFKSFQRQLNIYGWRKVHHGPNKGGYVHKHFVRGQPELCHKIVRRSTEHMAPVQAPHAQELAPSAAGVQCDPFVVFQGEQVIPLPQAHQIRPTESLGDLEENEVDTFMDFFYPGSPNKPNHVRQESFMNGGAGHWRVNTLDLDLNFDPEEIDMLRMEDNHQSRDHPLRGGRSDGNYEYPAPPSAHHMKSVRQHFEPPLPVRLKEEENSEAGTDTSENEDEDELDSDHSFPFKLHLMLETAERDGYSHLVSWVKDGKAFKVWNNKQFVAKVLPIYFDQSKYESFRRQLNLYGFSRVARGADRGVISHPSFAAGARWLCKGIKRKQQTKYTPAKGKKKSKERRNQLPPLASHSSAPIAVSI